MRDSKCSPPPRLAEWLIARFLPRDDRAPVLADLAELFAYRCTTGGTFSARLWHWKQVLSFPARIASDRARGDADSPHSSLPTSKSHPPQTFAESVGALMGFFLMDNCRSSP